MQSARQRRPRNSRESSPSNQGTKTRRSKSRRHSFESPKTGSRQGGSLSLLNYMILKEKITHQQGGKEKKSNFKQMYVVGKGGFGRVWKVEHKLNKKLYAMKEMSKAVQRISNNSAKSVMNERELISYLRHPFLVNIAYAFQDRENLYLVMDLMPGGDLRYHLCCIDSFSEKIVKFIAACIIIAIEYLHNNGVIHRDIKPENIVVDERGYFRLTDLGIAMVARPDNKENTSGTPGYMAPEVILRQNHSFPVDFFALGVIIYECALGRRPYRGRDRREIREAMVAREVTARPNELPVGWSKNAIDFINRLLRRRAEQRLGTRGISQVKNHPWLSDINWRALLQKQVQSPFYIDATKNNFDQPSITDNDQQTQQRINDNLLLIRNQNVNNIFQGYEYKPQKLF